MVRDPALPALSVHPSSRPLQRGMGWLGLLGAVVLALATLSVVLILWQGAEGAVRNVHAAMRFMRPFALAGQVMTIALVWWFWVPLVRRAKLPPAAERAWLAARHRLALWASGLAAMSAALWFPR